MPDAASANVTQSSGTRSVGAAAETSGALLELASASSRAQPLKHAPTARLRTPTMMHRTDDRMAQSKHAPADEVEGSSSGGATGKKSSTVVPRPTVDSIAIPPPSCRAKP